MPVLSRSSALAAAVLSLALLLPACSGVAGSGGDDAERRACLADGGTMQVMGRAGTLGCVRPMADAGRMCTDSSQCEARCLYTGDDVPAPDVPVTGQCAETDFRFGCQAIVEDGRTAGTICID